MDMDCLTGRGTVEGERNDRNFFVRRYNARRTPVLVHRFTGSRTLFDPGSRVVERPLTYDGCWTYSTLLGGGRGPSGAGGTGGETMSERHLGQFGTVLCVCVVIYSLC